MPPRSSRTTPGCHDTRWPFAGWHRRSSGSGSRQISDVHLPGTPATAEAAARIIERERPDVVVLTGDITEQASTLPALEVFAAAARGRLGTFAVLGNWEHKAEISPDTARAAYARAGVMFLCNESATLTYRGARLRIVGFDDPVVGQPDPARALVDPVPGVPEIWLIHAPAYIDTLPTDTPRPSVILAGHTHGGQIRLPGRTLYTPPRGLAATSAAGIAARSVRCTYRAASGRRR